MCSRAHICTISPGDPGYEDIQEAMDQLREMNEAMAQPLGQVMTEEELEAELAELEELSEEALLAYESHTVPQLAKSTKPYPIQKRRFLIVSGYIRQMKLHSDIINLVASFYGDATDSFHSFGDGIILDENVISNGGSLSCCVYLRNKMSEGVHSWTFEVSKEKGYVGIWKTKHEYILNDILGSIGHSKCYAWDMDRKYLMNPAKKGVLLRPYGSCPDLIDEFGWPGTREVIQMILDLNDLTLSFIINDIRCGVAFDIEKTEYVAVFTLKRNNEIRLLQYEHHLNEHDEDDDQVKFFQVSIKELRDDAT
eukprot:480242_1